MTSTDDQGNLPALSSPDDAGRVLAQRLAGEKGRKYARFVISALGSVPWVGGVVSAAAALNAESDQGKTNELLSLWVREHEEQFRQLGATLEWIVDRVDALGDEAKSRVESPEYQELVRQAFRSWDQASTRQKREMLAKLLANAAGVKLCTDDIVRLFIGWIDLYHEIHFLVVKEIHQNAGITRAGIWEKIRGEQPREDSAEADLFKLAIRDLSTGGLIRQSRETDPLGRFYKKSTRDSSSGPYMETAFEDTKPYALTALGRQFVHYAMTEVVQRIENGPGGESQGEPVINVP